MSQAEEEPAKKNSEDDDKNPTNLSHGGEDPPTSANVEGPKVKKEHVKIVKCSKVDRETSPSYFDLEIGDSNVELSSTILEVPDTPTGKNTLTLNTIKDADEPSTSKNYETLDQFSTETFSNDIQNERVINSVKESSNKEVINDSLNRKTLEDNFKEVKNKEVKTLGKCPTVKEIINEILDCKILRNDDKNLNVSVFPELKPHAANNNLGKQCTVKDVLGEILDFTICRKNTAMKDDTAEAEVVGAAATANVRTLSEFGGPSTSKAPTESKQCQSELGLCRRDFQVFR